MSKENKAVLTFLLIPFALSYWFIFVWSDILEKPYFHSQPETAKAAGSGDIAIYNETTATDAITTANFDHDWDNTIADTGTFINLNVDNTSVELKTGHYFVAYSSAFESTSGGGRSEIQSQLRLAGADLPIGWSQGYIRRTAGADEAITSAGAIIEVTNDDDAVVLRSFRTDSNGAGVQRVASRAAMIFMRLDDNWNYARLHKDNTQTGPTSSSWLTVTYNQQDELDTATFSHTSGSGAITLKSQGHYLVMANTYGAIPSTSSDRTLIRQRLTLDGSQVDGSLTTLYIRGDQGGTSTNEGAAATGMIIETTSANQVLNVEVNRGDGTAAWTINNDGAATPNTVARTAITIAKLPDNAEYIRLDDSGTDNMNPSSLTPLGWDTEDEIDTDTFTHPATAQPDSTVAVDIAGKYLFLTTLYAASAGVARAVPLQSWSLNGTFINIGGNAGYNRSAGADDVGFWNAAIFPSLSVNDYIEVEMFALAASGTVGADVKGLQGVGIDSLFKPVASNVSIDSGAASVNLTEGTTTTVSCVATVSDPTGFSDITSVKAELFRSGVGAGAADDDNDHYTLEGDTECVPSGGSGDMETYSCDFDVQYFADPTDSGTFSAEDWVCLVTPSDAGGEGTTDSDDIEMNSLAALSVTSSINYGTLALGADTGASNLTVTITNTGNVQIDAETSGTDMTCTNGTIPVANQKFGTSDVAYASLPNNLTSTTVEYDFDIAQQTNDVTPVTLDTFWGLAHPSTGVGGTCSGTNTYTAINDIGND